MPFVSCLRKMSCNICIILMPVIDSIDRDIDFFRKRIFFLDHNINFRLGGYAQIIMFVKCQCIRTVLNRECSGNMGHKVGNFSEVLCTKMYHVSCGIILIRHKRSVITIRPTCSWQ
jgi:hypothetical protein